MKNVDIAIQTDGIRSIRKLLGSSPEFIQIVIDAGCVPLFCNFLQVPICDVQIEAAWCLTNIASGGKKNKKNRIMTYSVSSYTILRIIIYHTPYHHIP